MLSDYTPKIFLGHPEEAFKLVHAVLADVAGGPGRAGLLQKPDGLLMVGLGEVEGVFKSGVVESFVIHATSVVPFPG